MSLTGIGGVFSSSGRAARRRSRSARNAPPGALRDLLTTPLPDLRTPLSEAPLLAVDIETSGLNPRRDVVLAIGYVPLDGGQIRLDGAGGRIVRPPADGEGIVGQSASVHGLTDDVVAAGVPLKQALEELLEALRGRIMLAHFAPIERDFLDAACRALHGVDLPLPCVDTLELQRRFVTGPHGHVRQGDLRLAAAREYFGLPRYRAHDALTDALASAELYLAQIANLGGGADMALRRVLS